MADRPIAGDPNASPFGGDMSMVMGLMGQYFAGSMGGVPGQFAPTMSFYDQMRQQEEQRRMFAAMRGVSAMEGETARKFGVGVSHILGQDPNDPTVAAGLDMVRDHYGAAVPFMTSMFGREVVGAMHGRQGSLALAAQDMSRIGRYTYDPNTGNYGMSGESTAALVTGAAKMLYGPGADPSVMRGIRMDQATDYYSQMRMTRGEGPASIRQNLSDADFQKIQANAGRPDFDIRNVLGKEKASQLSNSELAALTANSADPTKAAEGIDTARLASYVKDNVGMMRALKDVFGPNTPWSEAMQMARDLTQGNAQALNKNEMETFLRTSKELGEASGMGMQGMMNLTGFLGQYADQSGMSRRGVGQAVQAGAAYQQAFMAAGLGNIDRLDMQKLVTQSSQLTLQAGNSPVAAQLGAALNIDKMMGGKLKGDAADYVEALKSGKTTFGNGRSVMLSEDEFRSMMVAGGADASLVRDVRQMKDVNVKAAIDAGLDGTTRQLQFQRDLQPLLARGMSDMFGRAGLNGKNAMSAANAAIGAIMSMDHKMYAEDEDGRMEAIKASIKAAPGGANLTDAQLTQLAGSAHLQFENTASQRGWGNGSSVKALFDPKILSEQRLAHGRSKQMADFNKSLSGIGDDSLLQRVVTTVMEADGTTSPQDLVKSALNIVSNDKVKAAAKPHLEKLEAERAAYDKVLKDEKFFDGRELTEEGKKVTGDSKARIDSIIKDLTKSIDDVAPGMSTQKSPGKSSEKDKVSTDVVDGGKRVFTLAGKIDLGGASYPISGEAFI